ncbi:unnamed protein product [Tilletia caries]|nr:unnamed protein product [Tilletia caries]
MYLISLDRNCDELVDNPVTHDGHVEDVLAMHPHCGYSGPLDEEIQELLDQMQGDDPVDMRANKEFYRKTMSHALRVVWENKQFGDQFMSGYSTTAQSDDSDPIQYEFEEVSSANPDPISGLSPHAGSPTLIVAGARYVPDLGEAANRSHTNLASFIRSHKAVNRFAPTASGSFSPPVKTATQDIPSNKRGLSGSAAVSSNKCTALNKGKGKAPVNNDDDDDDEDDVDYDPDDAQLQKMETIRTKTEHKACSKADCGALFKVNLGFTRNEGRGCTTV